MPDELERMVSAAAPLPSPLVQALMDNQRQTADSLKRIEGSVGELAAGFKKLDVAMRGDDEGQRPGLYARTNKLEDVSRDHEVRLIHTEEQQAGHVTAIAANTAAIADLKDAKKDGFSRNWGMFILVASAAISFFSNLIFKLADYLLKGGSPHG